HQLGYMADNATGEGQAQTATPTSASVVADGRDAQANGAPQDNTPNATTAARSDEDAKQETQEQQRKRGMTDERKLRAETFKRIKDGHPNFSYAQVSIQAHTSGYPDATDEDVRNDYRAMGWEWERADRIR
ncbi:MAG: hypothetical protein ABI874_11060, partial [Chloroflexota bacterium]